MKAQTTEQVLILRVETMAKSNVLYIYDPLCGWCYGFSPVVQRINKQYHNRINIDVLSGGMVVGARVQPLSASWGYIGRSLHIVEDMAGVKFGAGFRALGEEGSYLYDSEPACIAMTIFKQERRERAVEFAHDIQRALFYDGRSLNDPNTYRDLVAPYGLDADTFIAAMSDEYYQGAAYREFDTVAEMGVSGYPMLLHIGERRASVLAYGYRAYDEVAAALDTALSTAE